MSFITLNKITYHLSGLGKDFLLVVNNKDKYMKLYKRVENDWAHVPSTFLDNQSDGYFERAEDEYLKVSGLLSTLMAAIATEKLM